MATEAQVAIPVHQQGSNRGWKRRRPDDGGLGARRAEASAHVQREGDGQEEEEEQVRRRELGEEDEEARRARRGELGEEDEEDAPLVAEGEVGTKLRAWARTLERPPKGNLRVRSLRNARWAD